MQECFHAIVRTEAGDMLLERISTTITIGDSDGVGNVIKLAFLDINKQDRGEISFNRPFLVSGRINLPLQQQFQKALQLGSIDFQPRHGECTLKVIFPIDSKFEANTKIGLDPEFKPMLEQLKSGKPLTIIFRGSKASLFRVTQMTGKHPEGQIKLSQKKYNSSDEEDDDDDEKYHTTTNVRRLSQQLIDSTTPGVVNPCIKFENKNHYLSVQAAGSQIEQDLIEEKAQKYNNREHKMVVIEIPNCGDREYQVFLKPPRSDDSKIQPGDRIKVLLPKQSHWNDAWVVIVSRPLAQTPEGYLTGHMKRPWKHVKNKAPELSYDNCRFPTISTDRVDLTKVVLDAQGIKVHVRLVVHGALLARRYECMEYMYRGIYDKHDAYKMTEAIEKILISPGSSNIPTFDVFRSIREEFDGQPEKLITELNAGQQLAVDMCKQAPAGIVLVQGPPGTGKTHFVSQLSTPYIMSQAKRKVLVTTQTNVGTINLSILYQKQIDLLKDQHSQSKWLEHKYVVHTHVGDLDIANFRLEDIRKNREPERLPDYREPSAAERRVVDNFFAELIKLNYLSQQEKPFVPEGKLSLGTRMLEIAGIISDGPKPENPDRFKRFRNGYSKWSKHEEMGAVELYRFWESAKELRNFVLQDATIVCTTVTNAASKPIRQNLRNRTDLIIADEMPRCLEADALMLLMGGFNPCGFIIVGDPDQLGLYVESKDDENRFAPQLCVSVQERLQRAGVPFTFLRVQHRMDPNLAKDTSDIIYNSRLEDHDCTKNRQFAQQIIGFNDEKFKIATNKLLLDIPEVSGRTSSITKQSTYKSRYNEDHVMYSFHLADEIARKFPEATVAILTGYQAQFGLLQAAKQNMIQQKAAHLNISIHKVDTVQGLEFDFVILDHLFLERGSAGFFRDPKRLNVASSRQKHGLYVLVDIAAYNNIPFMSTKSNKWIREFMARWRKDSYKVDVAQLTCKYYTPGSVNVDTGMHKY